VRCCTPSVPATNDPRIKVSGVAALWSGREGLFRSPHAPDRYAFPRSDERRGQGWRCRNLLLASARLRGLRDAYTARVELWRKDAHGSDPCPATGCGAGGTLDPMHVFFECTAPAVLAAVTACFGTCRTSRLAWSTSATR